MAVTKGEVRAVPMTPSDLVVSRIEIAIVRGALRMFGSGFFQEVVFIRG